MKAVILARVSTKDQEGGMPWHYPDQFKPSTHNPCEGTIKYKLMELIREMERS